MQITSFFGKPSYDTKNRHVFAGSCRLLLGVAILLDAVCPVIARLLPALQCPMGKNYLLVQLPMRKLKQV